MPVNTLVFLMSSLLMKRSALPRSTQLIDQSDLRVGPSPQPIRRAGPTSAFDPTRQEFPPGLCPIGATPWPPHGVLSRLTLSSSCRRGRDPGSALLSGPSSPAPSPSSPPAPSPSSRPFFLPPP